MKKYAISLTGAIIGVIVSAQGMGFTQEIPKLKQKMPYVQAREILIEAGWQAIEIPILQRGDHFFGATEYIVKELGYNEVVDCSGTGMGFCRFEFTTAEKRKLVVITANNQKGQQPILYRWQIEENP